MGQCGQGTREGLIYQTSNFINFHSPCPSQPTHYPVIHNRICLYFGVEIKMVWVKWQRSLDMSLPTCSLGLNMFHFQTPLMLQLAQQRAGPNWVCSNAKVCGWVGIENSNCKSCAFWRKASAPEMHLQKAKVHAKCQSLWLTKCY